MPFAGAKRHDYKKDFGSSVSEFFSIMQYTILQVLFGPLYFTLFPGGSDGKVVAQIVKSLPTMRETWVWSLGWENSPGEGNGNPLQYAWLENPIDGGAWQGTVPDGL